jgi:hypothetical protein
MESIQERESGETQAPVPLFRRPKLCHPESTMSQRRLLSLAPALLAFAACSVVQTRPVQEMSDTSAALRAAKEVQADVLAPELYRQAADWYSSARVEYRLKNFMEAKEYADKSRKYAEQAEYESVRAGASRHDMPPPPPDLQPEPYEYPEPPGTPAAAAEAMMQQQQRQAHEAPPAPPPQAP